ncbi:MAG: hypothetical protein HAW58_02155 [Candidatus Thioglobus sp.]|nr:hypothetical protein [Candidatus Thioglobus sp.]
MWINANLANLTAAETIISANNRQVLALKKTWQQQKGNSKLPKIFSYQQFLQNTYLQIFTNTSKRLISPIESRVLIGKSMLILGQSADNQLLDEVVKNIDYCHHHLISFEQLSKSHGQNSALFCSWSKHYPENRRLNSALKFLIRQFLKVL